MRSIGAALVVALASGLAPQTKPSAAKVQQKARSCVDLVQIASRATPSTRRRAVTASARWRGLARHRRDVASVTQRPRRPSASSSARSRPASRSPASPPHPSTSSPRTPSPRRPLLRQKPRARPPAARSSSASSPRCARRSRRPRSPSCARRRLRRRRRRRPRRRPRRPRRPRRRRLRPWRTARRAPPTCPSTSPLLKSARARSSRRRLRNPSRSATPTRPRPRRRPAWLPARRPRSVTCVEIKFQSPHAPARWRGASTPSTRRRTPELHVFDGVEVHEGLHTLTHWLIFPTGGRGRPGS